MANEFVIRAKIDTNPAKMQLNALKNEIAQKIREINKKEIRLGDIKTGKYLTDEMKTAKKELEYFAKEYVKKVDEINKKEIRLGGLKKGTILTDETKEAKKQLDALKKEYDKKESELAKKRENLSNLNSGKSSTYEIKEAKSQLSALEKVYDKKLSDIAKKESRLSDLQKGITLSDGTKEAKRQLEALKKEYNKKVDEISKKKIQLGDIQAGKTLTDGVKAAQKEVSAYEKRVEAAAKNVADLQKKYDKKASEKIPTGEMIAKDSTIRGEQGNLKRALTSIESLKARALEKGQLFSEKQIDEQRDRVIKAQEEGLGELAQTYLERLKEMEEANEKFESSDDFTTLKERAEVYVRAIQNAREEKEALIKAGQGYTSGAETEEAREIEAELSSAKEKYDELVQDLNIARAGVDKANSVAVNSLRDEITQSSGELVRLQEQINSAEQGVGRATSTAISSVSDEIAQDKRELDGIGIKVDEARQKVDSTTSKAASAVSDEIKKGEEELSKLKDEIKETERTADDATANAISNLSDEIRSDKDELVESQKELNEAANKLDNATASAINSVSTEISKDKGELHSLQVEMSNVGRTLNSSLSFNNFVTGVARVGTYVRSIAGSIWNMGTSVFGWVGKTAVSAIKKLFNGFTSLGSSVLDFGMKAASVFGGWLIDGISKVKDLTIGLGKAFLKVSEHLLGISMIKNVWGAVTGLFQRIMRLASLAFVFRVLTQGFRQLKNDVVDAFKTYLNYDSALNTSVNNLKNSFSTLKSQLASAFAPIIEIIVPYLTTFVNWCVTAANALSALIAALTGKTSWKKAVVSSVDGVSKGADNAADSLDNAADKAEELKEKLGAYDKLNVIQDDNDKKKSGSGNKGGGAGGSGNGGNGISYVDQSIGDNIRGLADWLKDMWNKADLSELGRKLGEMLRDSLKKIPWDKIQTEAKKTADRICTLIEGFVTTPGLAKELGKAIGELINTGIIFANEMVHKFPWKQTGQFLADGLNEAVKTIDFHMAGDTIATGLNGIMDLLNTFLDPKTGFDFSQLGKKIADFINTATTLDWQKLGTLATNLGTDIATFVNELSAAEVLTHIGDLIGHFIEAAVSAFKTFVENTNFKDLGTDFGGFVKKIGDSISQALTDLSTIDVAQKLQDFFDGLKSKIKKEDLEAWGTSIGTAFGSAIKGLATFLSNNKQAVYDALKSFVTGLTKGAGAAVTADTFKDIGKTLTTWLSNAIGDVSDWIGDAKNQKEIKDKLLGFFQGLADGWNEGTLGKLGRGIKSALGIIATTVTTWISNNKDKIIGEVRGFLDKLIGDGDGNLTVDDFSKLGKNLRSLLSDIATKITNWVNDENGLRKVLKDLEGFFDSLFGDQDGVLTLSDVTSFLGKVFGWIKDNVGSIFQASPVIAGLGGFLLALNSGLLGSFGKIAGNVALKFVGGLVEGIGKNITTKKITDSVEKSTVEKAGTTWGDWIGLALEAALLAKIGIAIAKGLAEFDKNKGFFENTQDASVNNNKNLDDAQKAFYNALRNGGAYSKGDFFGEGKFELANLISGWDELAGNGLSGFSLALEKAINSIDTSKYNDMRDALIDLRDSGIIPDTEKLEILNSYIDYLGEASGVNYPEVERLNKSISDSAVATDKSKVSYNDIRSAIEFLGKECGLSDEDVSRLNTTLNNSEQAGLSAESAYDAVANELNDGSEKGEKYANILKNHVNEQLKNVANNINNVKVTDLNNQLDTMATKGTLSAESVSTIKERIKELNGRDALRELIAALSETKGGAEGLKEVIANQLGISVKDLNTNADLVKGTLNQLFNPDGTEAGASKVDQILKMIGINMDEVDSKKATAHIDADTEKAKSKLGEVAGKADEFGEKTVTGKVGVDATDATTKLGDVVKGVSDFGNMSAEGKLKVDNSDVSSKLASSGKGLDDFDAKTAEATMEADATDVVQAGVEAAKAVQPFDGTTYETSIAGDDSGLQSTLSTDRNDIAGFVVDSATKTINADDSALQTTIINDNGDFAVFEEEPITKTIAGDDTPLGEVLSNVQTNLDETPSEKSINFVDLNSSGAALAILLGTMLNLVVRSIPNEKTITFKLKDETKEPIKTIKGSLNELKIHATNTVKPAIEDSFRQLFNNIDTIAKNKLVGSESVKATATTLKDSWATLISQMASKASSSFGEIASKANQNIASIASTATTKFTGSSGSVSSAISTMVSGASTKLGTLLGDFSRTFQSIYNTSSGWIRNIQTAINGLRGTTVEVNVTDNGETDALENRLNSLPISHTFTCYIEWVGETSKEVYLTTPDSYTAYVKGGGVYRNGSWSALPQLAEGGILNNSFWRTIPQYASGTAKAHGTVFVAGEAGPEAVAHINGRTEVLNKSQIAAAIYSAVRAAMGEYFLAAMSAVVQTIVNSANSINTNLGYLKDQYQLNNAYLNDVSVAGLSDVGALKSYYNSVISTSNGTNLDALAERVASKISGNFYINNQMTLDGQVVYDDMVQIDRRMVSRTGRSGFGG